MSAATDSGPAQRPDHVVVRTPAKINLALLVGPVRPDGFHELASVYQAVDLYDELTASAAEPGVCTIEVSGPGAASVPSGADSARNLAARAAVLLAEECGLTAGVRLAIRKGIPVAGGMAGGSSDAAAALLACDRLWGTALSRTRLLELAARLGSDVPFCLLGETALGSGRGELVRPVPTRGRYCWALALTSDGLSTPQVYAHLDARRAGTTVGAPEVGPDLLSALGDGDTRAVGQSLSNDLQPATLSIRPELRLLLEDGTRLGALGSLVSGSGPTCAFLAEDPEHATAIATGLRASGRCEQVTTATGPVSGATVLESSVRPARGQLRRG